MAKKKKEDLRDPLTKRIDALIRIMIEMNRSEKTSITDGFAARMLHSSGLSSSEIALILGKKSATDLNQYIYSKSNK